MAIAPISNVKLNQYNNSVSFGSRRKNLELPEENNNNQPSGKKMGKLASVPVIVMMAMAPGMMDGKTPANVIPMDSEQLTELIAQNTSSMEEAAPLQSSSKKNARYWEVFNRHKDRISKSFEIIDADNNGIKGGRPRSYTLTFETISKDRKNDVYMIYLYPHDMVTTPEHQETCSPIRSLVHHKTEYGEDFWGVITDPRGQNGCEVRIPDEVAQEISDLINGEHELNYKGGRFMILTFKSNDIFSIDLIQILKERGKLF